MSKYFYVYQKKGILCISVFLYDSDQSTFMKKFFNVCMFQFLKNGFQNFSFHKDVGHS